MGFFHRKRSRPTKRERQTAAVYSSTYDREYRRHLNKETYQWAKREAAANAKRDAMPQPPKQSGLMAGFGKAAGMVGKMSSNMDTKLGASVSLGSIDVGSFVLGPSKKGRKRSSDPTDPSNW